MKKILLLSAAALALAGCEVGVETTINSDDLLLDTHKRATAMVDVEVAACSDFEDSRKESRSLIKIKGVAKTIFNNAEYLECYQQKFESFARFSVPVGVGSLRNVGAYKAYEEADIHIISSDTVYLGVMILPELLDKIEQAKKDLYGKFDMNFSIVLNKGAEPIPELFVAGAYLSNEKISDDPVVISRINIKTNQLTMRLSDVTNSIIARGNIGPVLYTKEAMRNMMGSE